MATVNLAVVSSYRSGESVGKLRDARYQQLSVQASSHWSVTTSERIYYLSDERCARERLVGKSKFARLPQQTGAKISSDKAAAASNVAG